MSIKSKMVKALSALTAMSIVACASITGFAATYTTTTVYNVNGNSDAVLATTQVTGAQPKEQVTYLVHNAAGSTIADSDIIYINQDAATDEGTATFSYQTTKTKIAGLDTTVLVGAQSSTVTSSTADDATIDAYTITVTPYTNGNVSIADQSKIGKGETIQFTVTPDTGYEIGTVAIDGVNQAAIGGVYSITGDSNKTIAVTFNALQGESTITDGESPSTVIDTVTPANNSITSFGSVSVIPEDETKTVEFGILFATGAQTADSLQYGNDGVTAYPSLGKGTGGKFAVKLIDGGSGLITNQVYSTRTYLMVNGTVVKYGRVNVVNQ